CQGSGWRERIGYTVRAAPPCLARAATLRAVATVSGHLWPRPSYEADPSRNLRGSPPVLPLVAVTPAGPVCPRAGRHTAGVVRAYWITSVTWSMISYAVFCLKKKTVFILTTKSK